MEVEPNNSSTPFASCRRVHAADVKIAGVRRDHSNVKRILIYTRWFRVWIALRRRASHPIRSAPPEGT
jgi:hypothetical protein